MKFSKKSFSLAFAAFAIILLAYLLIIIVIKPVRESVYLFQVPNSGVLIRDQKDDNSYCFLGESFDESSLHSFDKKNLVTRDLQNEEVMLDEPLGMKRHKKYMRVTICADDMEMATAMGNYTDNLATHDCLYRAILRPIWLLEMNAARNCKDRFRILLYNLSTIQSELFGNKIDNLDKLTYRSLTSYKYLYYDKELRTFALFEDFRENEAAWNLYYYPSIGINELDLEASNLVNLFEDENGRLLRFAVPYCSSYSHFCRIDNNQYYRIASSQSDLSLSGDGFPDKEVYLFLTRNANKLIKSYFQSILSPEDPHMNAP